MKISIKDLKKVIIKEAGGHRSEFEHGSPGDTDVYGSDEDWVRNYPEDDNGYAPEESDDFEFEFELTDPDEIENFEFQTDVKASECVFVEKTEHWSDDDQQIDGDMTWAEAYHKPTGQKWYTDDNGDYYGCIWSKLK